MKLNKVFALVLILLISIILARRKSKNKSKSRRRNPFLMKFLGMAGKTVATGMLWDIAKGGVNSNKLYHGVTDGDFNKGLDGASGIVSGGIKNPLTSGALTLGNDMYQLYQSKSYRDQFFNGMQLSKDSLSFGTNLSFMSNFSKSMLKTRVGYGLQLGCFANDGEARIENLKALNSVYNDIYKIKIKKKRRGDAGTKSIESFRQAWSEVETYVKDLEPQKESIITKIAPCMNFYYSYEIENAKVNEKHKKKKNLLRRKRNGNEQQCSLDQHAMAAAHDELKALNCLNEDGTLNLTDDELKAGQKFFLIAYKVATTD